MVVDAAADRDRTAAKVALMDGSPVQPAEQIIFYVHVIVFAGVRHAVFAQEPQDNSQE